MIQTLWHFAPLILVTLISAGIGALLYAGVSAYLNRKPVIGRRVDILQKFEDLHGLSLQSQITISDGQNSYRYEHLHIVQVEVANQSRYDFDQFQFGITLSSDDILIYIEAQPIDRHHLIKQLSPVTFAAPRSSVDLILQPFNRDDIYRFRLSIVTETTRCSPNPIVFSTPEAVRFVDMPTTQKALENAARTIALPLGPFKISFR
jgi:hypothetical protein